MIPYGRQNIDDSDIQAVVEVLRSDYLTQGPWVPRFEAALAAYCGVPHAVAMNSATSALHLACLALGLGPGDQLWTTPNTFVASANCARYCGAQVDFVDIDPATYNLSVSALAAKLADAARKAALPKIVVPVDFAGQPCELAEIAELARRYGVKLLEDASHAVGAEYRGGKVGDCRYADITVFSFHPVKVITTGEGGMAFTRDPELARRMARLRTHGISRDPADMNVPPPGEWYYEQIELGYNFRMTDLQAALGWSQLKRLPAFIARRQALAAEYDRLLAGLPVQRPRQHPDGRSSWHLYVVCLNNSSAARRREVFRALRAAGIGVNVHYIPVHTQPYYRQLGFKRGDFPVAEAYSDRCLSLPLHPGLTDADQDAVVAALSRVLQ